MASYLKARIAENESDEDKATDFYLEAAKADPDHYPSLQKAAIGLVLKQQTDEALRLVKEYHDRHPTEVDPIADLAEMSVFDNKLKESAMWLETAIVLEPTNSAHFLHLAKLYLLAKDADPKVLDVLHRGTKTADPILMVSCAIVTGASFLRSDETDRAVPWFEFAAKHSDHDKGKIALILSEIMEKLKDREKEEYWLSIVIAEPRAPRDCYLKLAFLLARKNDFAGAIAVLDRAEENFPDDFLIESVKGYIYLNARQAVAASEAFSRAAKKADEKNGTLSRFFHLNYGAACDQAGDKAKAEEIFEKGIALYPEAHEILNYIAYMWAEQNRNLDKALEYVQRALKHDKDNGAYIDTLGWIYYRKGMFEEALDAITRANNIIENDPTITEHCGDIWMALGNHKKAVQYWRKSIKLNPDNAVLKNKLNPAKMDKKNDP